MKIKGYDAVIVNYFGEKIITECLESLFSSSVLPKRVIIYDNNSQDDSIRIIREKFPKVILIEGKHNIGFARANNAATERVVSDFILFMNNDVILDEKCAEKLLEALGDPDIAISNPAIFKGWEKEKDAEVYSFGAEMNRGGFGYSLLDTSPDRTDLSCFSGACFMARSKAVKKLQFENNFFMYYEEPDLSVKILQAGWKIGRTGQAKCYHLENYSSPKKLADGICFRQFYAIQNRWYMLGKFWPPMLLLSAMPVNLLHLIYNAVFFLRNGQAKKTTILFLAFKRLFNGRKLYKSRNDVSWTEKLSGAKLSSLLSIKKKVYK